MSIIYFTNNADSGDGTLRDAITTAASGDIIEPSGFDAGNIEILLSSYLPTKGVTIRGGDNNRIILNGQGSTDFFRLSGSIDLAFEDVDFVNGYRSTAGTINASGFNTLTFTRCSFVGNSAAYAGLINLTAAVSGALTFADSYAWGNTAAGNNRAGVVYCATSAACTIAVNGCTFAGTTDGKAEIVDGGQTTITGSIIQNYNTEGETLNAADFIDLANGDLRLSAGSSYLTGGLTTGTDFYGKARDGSLGAFAGAYVVNPDASAGVLTFTATATAPRSVTLSWTAEDLTAPVVLERLDGEEWTLLDSEATGGTATADLITSGTTTFRLLDGTTIFTDAAWSSFGAQLKVISQLIAGEEQTTTPSSEWEAVIKMITTTEDLRVGQSFTIKARIYDSEDETTYFLNDGTNVKSVTYTITRKSSDFFSTSSGTSVTGHTDATAPTTCVLEALQTASDWPDESAGYNFELTPDNTTNLCFPSSGSYTVKVTIELTDGNPIVFYEDVTVK